MPEKGIHFDYEIKFPGASCVMDVILKKGQSVNVESGAMIYHDTQMTLETIKASKGVLSSLKRTLAGEKFWMNKFTAEEDGVVGVGPSFPGDIKHLKIEKGEEWVIFKNAFIACSPGLEMGTKFKGMKKAIVSTGRSFQLVARAEENDEDLIISALGGFITRELAEGETLRIDNDHFVAREKSVDWGHRMVGGFKSSLFSGEGIIIEARGPGKIIMQTRSNVAFAEWIYKMIRSKLPRG